MRNLQQQHGRVAKSSNKRTSKLRMVAGTPRSAPTELPLKQQLLQLVTRLNTTSTPTRTELSELLVLVDNLSKCNPTLRPAESPLINGRWALLYTVNLQQARMGSITSASMGTMPQAESLLQAASDSAYQLFYQYLPILAGSAVGRRGSSSPAVKSRGNFQIFDTTRGIVENQARFEVFGSDGVINVNGTASVAASTKGERLKATFTSFEVVWGGSPRVRLPLTWLNPTGYVDTSYLDDELRISMGDKGSLFIANRVKA